MNSPGPRTVRGSVGVYQQGISIDRPAVPGTTMYPFHSTRPELFEAHSIYSNDRTGKGYLKFHGHQPTGNVVLDTVYRNMKSYTKPLVRPDEVKSKEHGKEDVCVVRINGVSFKQFRSVLNEFTRSQNC